MNTAFCSNGFYLKIEKGEKLKMPIHIIYISGSETEALVNSRNFIELEEQSEATIIEEQILIGQGKVFTNFLSEKFISKNAKLNSTLFQNEGHLGYSVAVTNNKQEADTGTKMIHIGKNTRSTIISKGISAGFSNNSYRGLVQIRKGSTNSRNFSQCDSLLMGDKCGAHTFPYIEIKDKSAVVEHEATTSKIGEDQLFYCKQRGISMEKSIALIVNGYCKEVLNKLPMEFAVEAQKLLAVSLEGSVG